MNRIENLVLVSEAPAVAGGERPLDHFETLTLVPIDRRLVDRRLMTTDEVDWFDAYHADVRETLMPLVAPDTQAWLAAATAQLGRS
jgi:Xaa-Pro aminopeptidase